MSVTPWRLIERDTGAIVVERLELADRFWSRLRGLQFRRILPEESGLLLVPCSGIHTFWMRFAIDVAFLSGQGRVLEVRANIKPWRIVWPVRGAHAVLEIAAGQLLLAPGSWLQLEAPRGLHLEPPPALRFLA